MQRGSVDNWGFYTIRRASLRAIKALGVSLCFVIQNHSASAQTVQQSVGFILSSGLLDPTEIRAVGDDRFSFATTMTGDAFEAKTLQMSDQSQCVTRIDGINTLYNASAYKEYFFDNIILDEVKSTPSPSGQWVSLHFFGEKDVICETITGRNRTCSKSFALSFPPLTYDRMINAIKYVYSTFCTPAKRRSAF